MKMKVDAKVLHKNVEIELTKETLEKIFNDKIKSMPIPEIVKILSHRYKKSRGVDYDAFVEEGRSFWREYEDHGCHYSGNYDTKVKVTEEDRTIMQAIKALSVITK